MEIKVWEEFDEFYIPVYKAKVSVVYEDFVKELSAETLNDLIIKINNTIHDSFGE